MHPLNMQEMELLTCSNKRALRIYLRKVLLHLLIVKFQPEKRSRYCDGTILNGRRDLSFLLKDSQSLRKLLPDYIYYSYEMAVTDASIEIGKDERIFPKVCPWSLEEILGG